MRVVEKSANSTTALRHRDDDVPSTLLVYDNTVSYLIKVASCCYCKHGQKIKTILTYNFIINNIGF